MKFALGIVGALMVANFSLAKQCPTLTAPANGAQSPTGATDYQDTVTFTCNTGYRIVGALNATCQADGTWSNSVPECTDVDECKEKKATCPDGATCLNTPGGYRCTYCTPEVTILGEETTSIPRSRAFRLNSRSYFGVNCTEMRDVRYEWEVSPSGGKPWLAVVTTKADLYIPPMTLPYAGLYKFKMNVLMTVQTYPAPPNIFRISNTSNSVYVTFTPTPLIPLISGGTKRYFSAGWPTRLDVATLSSDPDGAITSSADLEYRWSCASTNGVCPSLDGQAGGLLTVNITPREVNSELTFTVEVSAPNRSSAFASQIIEVVPSAIPLTGIVCDTTYGTCGPKINSGEKMRLSVLCSSLPADPNNYTYNWTLVQTHGSPTTWTEEDWRTNVLNDRSHDYVTFRAEVFDTQDHYTVTATVTDINTGESGSAEYSFTVNEPPTLGDCDVHSVDNRVGFFEIQCQGFSDADLPLSYNFEYTAADVQVASINSTARSNRHLLYCGSTSSTPPIRLPVGNPDENYELEITIRVTDVFGAFSVTRVNTTVVPPENVEEFVEAVLNEVDVDDVQQTTSSIASAASMLNVATATNAHTNVKLQSMRARDRMVGILEQVQVLDVQQVKQVSGTLGHVTNKPEELSVDSQVKATDTLKTLGQMLTTSSEVGSEELEEIAAHLVTGAINILEANSQSVDRERLEAKLQNRTADFEKNRQAVTSAFETIDELSSTLIARKNRDEKPTLVRAKKFLMFLAKSSCDRHGARIIHAHEQALAYFEIPQKTMSKLCVNGSISSQTYFSPQNPFGFANNADDVRTPVLGLSVLGADGRPKVVRNLEEDERIKSIIPIPKKSTVLVKGTAPSSKSGQISLHNFNTTKQNVALYVRIIPDVTNVDTNVTLRAYLKRGAVVSPDDYSHNTTLTRTGVTTYPYTWFLNQTALNTSNEVEEWAIGLQLEAVTGPFDSGNYTISASLVGCS